jgi:membrane-bound lytic murein transglycosylase D
MKKSILFILSLAFSSSSLLAVEEVEGRLKGMSCLVPIKTDPSVTNRIQGFIKGRRDTEKMIGRSTTFFPIFDQYLKQYDLPSDLKYLTCLETELDNKVVSTSGAKGIWQLMPDVKEEFGLRIDGTLDERLDLNRGTEAALKDMKRMYKAYGDWEMVLAGYNCGVGRLAAAIKRAKSNDFEKVKKFLPEQTQQYIPKFIAFTYIMKNYRAHGLKPVLPSLDLQMVANVKVYNYISLSTIASVTGMPYDIIKDLNQEYGEGYVPENKAGSNVVVPRRVMNALVDYVTNPDVKQQANLNFTPMVIDENLPKLEGDPNYFKTTYMIGEDETIEAVADLFNIGVYNIMVWNNLDKAHIHKGQELTLYLPRVVPKRA